MAIRLNGSVSGYVALDAPSNAASNTLTLPSGNGSNTQVLATNGSGDLSWASNNPIAWVNFNGTGTVSIRSELNVSSITDNGVGDYTINFTSPLPSANYSFLISGRNMPKTTNTDMIYGLANGITPTTTAFRITVTDSVSGGTLDSDYVCAAFIY